MYNRYLSRPVRIPNAFLALPARAPAHGYELTRAGDETFTGVWPPINVGQISTTLGRLERDGIAESVHSPRSTGRTGGSTT